MNPAQQYHSRKVSELARIGVAVPDFQRLTSEKHIEAIYQHVKKGFVQTGIQPVLPGCIVVCRALSGTGIWLIDGQHRFLAFQRLLEQDHIDVVVMTCEIVVRDEEEAHEYFRLVNTNLPMKKPPRNVTLAVPNQVARKFVECYPLMFKDSENPRRPHLNVRHFAERLAKCSYIRGWTVDLIFAALLQHNQVLSGKPVTHFKYPGDTTAKLTDLKTQAEKKGGLLFGLYKDYEFVDQCFKARIADVLQIL